MLGWQYLFWPGVASDRHRGHAPDGRDERGQGRQVLGQASRVTGGSGRVRGRARGRRLTGRTRRPPSCRGRRLEWYGTATFRVRDAGLDLFFDAYLDRLPGLDPVGLSTAEVDTGRLRLRQPCPLRPPLRRRCHRAAHGATVVASPESARCLRASGVPEEQLLVVTGGETVAVRAGARRSACSRPSTRACSPTVRPTRPSPVWATSDVSAQQRAADGAPGFFGAMDAAPPPAGPALVAMNEACSRHDGGQLAYLLTTAGARCWSAGVPATGAASSTACVPTSRCSPSVAGPTSTASRSRVPRCEYLLEQVQTLRPGRVACLPPRPAVPRPTRGRHRAGGGGLARARCARRLLRAGVRHAGPALRLSARRPSPPSDRQPRRSERRQISHQDGDGFGDVHVGRVGRP